MAVDSLMRRYWTLRSIRRRIQQTDGENRAAAHATVVASLVMKYVQQQRKQSRASMVQAIFKRLRSNA
jgi:hypothetical protein